VTGLLGGLLRRPRTRTAGQLAGALRPHGVSIGPRPGRRDLRLMGAGDRRTANGPRHRQDPAEVARAKAVPAGPGKKPGRAG
jgi:hypothetical protein